MSFLITKRRGLVGKVLGSTQGTTTTMPFHPRRLTLCRKDTRGMVMVRKTLWVGMPIGEILTIALRGIPTHPMCCVRTQMEMYLLDMLVLMMVMPIDGTQFGYLNLLLLMLGVPLPNGFLNPIIDFVGLFLRWAKMVV
jgi:hypothetical protein